MLATEPVRAASSRVRLTPAPAVAPEGSSKLLFQLSHHFLEEAHLLSHGMQLEPVSVMIVETVRVGAMERALRLPEGLARNARQMMSRRAVAVATGLPRETVRRRVKRLVEQGVLLEEAGGALSVVDQADAETGHKLQRQLANHVAMTNALIEAGLIQICPAEQACGRSSPARGNPRQLELR